MTITGVPRLHPTEHRVIGDREPLPHGASLPQQTRGDISVAGVDWRIRSWCRTNCTTRATVTQPTPASG